MTITGSEAYETMLPHHRVLGQMHGAAGHAETPAAASLNQADDPQAAVLSLLLQGAAALARAGEADRARRLAASAWAALHEARPDLAATVTAALHGLARRVSEGSGGPDDGDPDAAAEREFTWDYVHDGPKVWRVRIGRADV